MARRSSSRSSVSSIDSRRCETERSRRVTRSTSAADGMLRAPSAASCAWTAFSRASKARGDGAADERVADQLLGELAKRLLALAGDAVYEGRVVIGGHRSRQAIGHAQFWQSGSLI